MLPWAWVAKFNWSRTKALKNYVPFLWNVSQFWFGSCLRTKVKLDPISARKPDQKRSTRTFFHDVEIGLTPFSSACHDIRKITFPFGSDWEAIGEAAWGKHSPSHPSRLSTCSSCSIRKAGNNFWNLWVAFIFTGRHLPVGVCNAKVYRGERCLSSHCTQDIQSKASRDYFGSPNVVAFFRWSGLSIASPLYLQYSECGVDPTLAAK